MLKMTDTTFTTVTDLFTQTITMSDSTVVEPGMQTITRDESTLTRINLGPLTTVFTPPRGCDACYVGSTASWEIGCTAFFDDCRGSRLCLPDITPSHSWAFYSPGLLCPAEWTTATVVSATMTDSLRATSVLRTLTADETAGFCCPS